MYNLYRFGEVMRIIIDILKVPLAFLIPLVLRRGSSKLKRQLKKNKKEQNPNIFPFEER
jgi:hypothetical protein